MEKIERIKMITHNSQLTTHNYFSRLQIAITPLLSWFLKARMYCSPPFLMRKSFVISSAVLK